MGKYSAIRERAIYASDPVKCRGRRIAQPSGSERSPFQRDKDRIIHSSCLLYTSPSPREKRQSRMPSSA